MMTKQTKNISFVKDNMLDLIPIAKKLKEEELISLLKIKKQLEKTKCNVRGKWNN